jgi:hypothetical protein
MPIVQSIASVFLILEFHNGKSAKKMISIQKILIMINRHNDEYRFLRVLFMKRMRESKELSVDIAKLQRKINGN